MSVESDIKLESEPSHGSWLWLCSHPCKFMRIANVKDQNGHIHPTGHCVRWDVFTGDSRLVDDKGVQVKVLPSHRSSDKGGCFMQQKFVQLAFTEVIE